MITEIHPHTTGNVAVRVSFGTGIIAAAISNTYAKTAERAVIGAEICISYVAERQEEIGARRDSDKRRFCASPRVKQHARRWTFDGCLLA